MASRGSAMGDILAINQIKPSTFDSLNSKFYQTYCEDTYRHVSIQGSQNSTISPGVINGYKLYGVPEILLLLV